MAKRWVLTSVLVFTALWIGGCQTVEGIGKAFQGVGGDLEWLSRQRVRLYEPGVEGQQSLYVFQIDGRQGIYRQMDGRFVKVANLEY